MKMNDINDIISAISSASLSQGQVGKSIIRISGPNLKDFQLKGADPFNLSDRQITSWKIEVADGFSVEVSIYFFQSPRSYTGQDLVEIHIIAAESVVERLLARVLEKSRMAEAGEFTLRGYLNGKIDLSQAEAVAAIVSGSNSFQLSAAEKLLDGSLCASITGVREDIMELMSLIEAGLDFSEEDIEFVSKEQAISQIKLIKDKLENVLASSVRYEEMIDMASVGLAGAANVGKSSLLNKLLNTERSIVADEHGTTRDVLTGILELDNVRCALFDCAGLKTDTEELLDGLANQAAVESLKSATVVLMCIDATRFDLAGTEKLLKLIGLRDNDRMGETNKVIYLLTKCDLIDEDEIAELLKQIENRMGKQAGHPTVLAISSQTEFGINELRETVENEIVKLQSDSTEVSDRIAINQRHRQLIESAIDDLAEANDSVISNNEEVTTMILRQVYQSLGGVEREHVDEAVLDRIFSSFCIGK